MGSYNHGNCFSHPNCCRTFVTTSLNLILLLDSKRLSCLFSRFFLPALELCIWSFSWLSELLEFNNWGNSFKEVAYIRLRFSLVCLFCVLGFISRYCGFRQICDVTSGKIMASLSLPASVWEMWPLISDPFKFMAQCGSVICGWFFLFDIKTFKKVLASCRLWDKTKMLCFWVCQDINLKDLLCNR